MPACSAGAWARPATPGPQSTAGKSVPNKQLARGRAENRVEALFDAMPCVCYLMYDMKKHIMAHATVRRSVALPRALVEAAAAKAPPELRDNMNRLVRVALEEFVARRVEREFEQTMIRMAADPALRAASTAISDEFVDAEEDGLP